MQNRMRTIWLTGHMLIALLLSSMPASASLIMPVQNLAGGQVVSAVSNGNDIGCTTFQQNITFSEVKCCDVDSIIPDHQCCPVTCVAGYLMTAQLISTSHQISKLVLIPRETVRHANSVASTLFRPPII